tara:strand:+ start:976 stop:1320 length:345 start_codon:yes stop_codon:yes gene_type:complete
VQLSAKDLQCLIEKRFPLRCLFISLIVLFVRCTTTITLRFALTVFTIAYITEETAIETSSCTVRAKVCRCTRNGFNQCGVQVIITPHTAGVVVIAQNVEQEFDILVKGVPNNHH